MRHSASTALRYVLTALPKAQKPNFYELLNNDAFIFAKFRQL
jgi:hypothetical protein